MLLLMQAEHPTSLDDLKMSRIIGWTPDERDHLAVFEQRCCRDVFHQTGVNPVLLGAWACSANILSKQEMQQVLKASDAQIWHVVEEWEKELEKVILNEQPGSDAEANLFAPGPAVIAELLAGGV